MLAPHPPLPPAGHGRTRSNRVGWAASLHPGNSSWSPPPPFPTMVAYLRVIFMASHFIIPGWRSPWTEELGGLVCGISKE